MERMPMWQIAIRRLEMPVSRFITIYVGGAFAGGLLASLLLIFVTGGFAEGALFAGLSGILLLFLLPILAALGALAFPMLEVSRSANLIEREKCTCSLREWVFCPWAKLVHNPFSIFSNKCGIMENLRPKFNLSLIHI